MDTTIKFLREQTILCRRVLELFEQMIKGLEENSPEVIESAQKIEKFIPELKKNSLDAQKFLQSKNCKSFAEYIAAQEDSTARNVAERLLIQSDSLQDVLKIKLATADKLIQSGANFVAFNLNLMSQTRADTYGANSLSEGMSKRRIVEFKC